MPTLRRGPHRAPPGRASSSEWLLAWPALIFCPRPSYCRMRNLDGETRPSVGRLNPTPLGHIAFARKKYKKYKINTRILEQQCLLCLFSPYTGRVVPAASLSTRRIGSHKVTRCFHMFSLAVRLADVYSRVRPVEIPVDWERQPCLPLLFTLYVQYLCIHRERKRGSACCDTLHL